MKWIMSYILPLLFVLLGLIVLIAKPKRNSWFGYRTGRSLASDFNWNYANKVMAILLIVSGVIAAGVVSIINVYVEKVVLLVLLNVLAIPLVGLLSVVLATELMLRKKIALNNDKNNK